MFIVMDEAGLCNLISPFEQHSHKLAAIKQTSLVVKEIKHRYWFNRTVWLSLVVSKTANVNKNQIVSFQRVLWNESGSSKLLRDVDGNLLKLSPGDWPQHGNQRGEAGKMSLACAYSGSKCRQLFGKRRASRHPAFNHSNQMVKRDMVSDDWPSFHTRKNSSTENGNGTARLYELKRPPCYTLDFEG